MRQQPDGELVKSGVSERNLAKEATQSGQVKGVGAAGCRVGQMEGTSDAYLPK